jgi:hypothetical protein
MESAQIKLYDIFRKKFNLPDADAKETVEAFTGLGNEAKIETKEQLEGLATKEFVRAEIKDLEATIKGWMLATVITLVALILGLYAIIVFGLILK